MTEQEAIVAFLEQDKIRNMNMIYFMEQNPVHFLKRTGDSVLMKGDSDHRWVYISCPDEQGLNLVIKQLNSGDRFFAVIEDWMFPALSNGRTIAWQLVTLKLILPDDVTFHHDSRTEITPLSVKDAEYLYGNLVYQGVTSPEYIRQRIQRGFSVGIRHSGKLVAWAMTHDDSAIGLLHVLDEYRRKGYAYDLTVNLIRQLRAKGRIPFVHIEEDNEKSISLAKKLGFREDRRVRWFEVDDRP